MANVIVGIHGLSNKPEKSEEASWWKGALLEGLRVNCDVSGKDLSFTMVYWANLLYTHPLHNKPGFSFDSLHNEEPYVSAAPGALKEYKEKALDEIRAFGSSVGGTTVDKLKGWMGLDGVADKILEHTLRDLAFYYDRNQMILDSNHERVSARAALMAELQRELLSLKEHRILLISHSMGSIIAYDVLRQLGQSNPGFTLAQFVTIGSPLGLPLVKARVVEEYSTHVGPALRTPTVVTESWVNYADRKDPVALDTHLADDYAQNGRRVQVQDDLVLNDYVSPKGKANHHKSYGYLRTPELSRQVLEFLR